jgi:protein-S-isoprenylcysteine O-methyltransferase Ste14
VQGAKLFPPVYFLGALALTALLHYILPAAPVIPATWHLGGLVLIAVGLFLIVAPARTFKSRDTAIKPFEESSVLVQDGLFAVSRNPMYLGMVLVVLGVIALLRGAVPFIVPIVLVVVLYVRFIRFEEQALEQNFGDDYRAYKARVRRWL